MGWIGVDLDGTLAEYHGWVGDDFIGEPVKVMRDRVIRWRAEGKDVRLFTARRERHDVIAAWCKQHLGEELPITCKKDFTMVELWDDRAVQVIPNTGERADGVAE